MHFYRCALVLEWLGIGLFVVIIIRSMSHRDEDNGQLNQSQPHFFQSSSQTPLISFDFKSSQLVDRLRAEPFPSFEEFSYSSVTEKAMKYLQFYLREFQKNKRLNNELAEVISDRNLLATKYNSIKASKTTDDSVHRKRRYAKEIQRLFYCPIERCRKGYGSQGSLSHHIRLKHLEYYQSGQYQQFIQKYTDELNEAKKRGMAVAGGPGIEPTMTGRANPLTDQIKQGRLVKKEQ